jgi:hypothetical protein
MYLVAATLLASILAALISITWQLCKARRDAENARIEERAQRRREIVTDLIAYRFVLSNKIQSVETVSRFKYALSRIPMEFMDNKDILDKYRDFGNNFTPEKFYEFIKVLLDSINANRMLIDKSILENMPSANTKQYGIAAFNPETNQTIVLQLQADMSFSNGANPKPSS